MTTAAREVRIGLAGTGTATIDWGDGSEAETKEIVQGGRSGFSREFSDGSSRTITITGDSITLFNCSNNQITALDVSRNTALTYLDCSENQLTALDISRNTALIESGVPPALPERQ